MSAIGTINRSEIARPRSWRTTVFRGSVGALALALLIEAANVLTGPNFHEVVPGAIYRTSQPSAERLQSLIRRFGIRTVVNLRGVSDPTEWYLEECRTTATLGVSQEDLPFSAARLPSVPVVRRMVQVIDRSEYPILFHCNRGIDRTGMAVTAALLLHTDIAVRTARAQLGLRHGHLAFGRTGNIDRFFDLYEEWLVAHEREHSRAAFRQWIEREYCPGECRCEIEMLDPEQLGKIPAGKAVGTRIRVTNTSVKPWVLKPGKNAGIQCHATLQRDEVTVWEGHAGLFHATVPPGVSIDLTVALPALTQRGRYRLQLDMNDPQHAFFHQMGSEPFLFDLEVQ